MDLVYKEEAYKINGLAMKVYNTLGPGFLESVYQEALEIEFIMNGIPFVREAELSITYAGIELKKKFVADFICYDKIIIELKAVEDLNAHHEAQLMNYLRATGFKLGLLLNFGNKYHFQSHRIVN